MLQLMRFAGGANGIYTADQCRHGCCVKKIQSLRTSKNRGYVTAKIDDGADRFLRQTGIERPDTVKIEGPPLNLERTPSVHSLLDLFSQTGSAGP